MVKKSNDYAILNKKIRYDKTISLSAKMLFGVIESLCFKEGFCWAANKYFADLYQVSIKTVEKWIKDLDTHGYITRTLIFYPNSKKIKQRILKIKVKDISLKKTKKNTPKPAKTLSQRDLIEEFYKKEI